MTPPDPARAQPARSPIEVALYGHTFSLADDIWALPNPTPGAHQLLSTIKWATRLPDGSSLTEESNQPLLRELKLAVVSVAIDVPHRRPFRATTTAAFGRGLIHLAGWMKSAGICRLSEITNELSWSYAEYCDQMILAASDDVFREPGNEGPDTPPRSTKRLRRARFWRDLWALTTLYRQRVSLGEVEVGPPCECPFDGLTPYRVAGIFGYANAKRLEPVPDDVAIPGLNAALRFVGTPARDVIELQKLHSIVRATPAHSSERNEAYKAYNSAISSFKFSVLDGERGPWREPISDDPTAGSGPDSVPLSKGQQVRRLVISAGTAGVVLVQGLTGMRAHEILGLKETGSGEDWLPSCVETELSKDGVVELFFVKGCGFKGKSAGEMRWLIGSRLVGTDLIPPAVQALIMLRDLFQPWRDLSGRNDLIVTLATQGLPNSASSIGRMTTSVLSNHTKSFFDEYVDLSGASQKSRDEFVTGRGIRGHRWRRTFALFVYRISKGLLPALSDHFKHVNTQVTENGYIGTDPDLLEGLGSARNQASAEYLLSVTSPGARLAGGGAKRLKELADKLNREIDVSPGATRIEKTISAVEKWGLHVYPAAFGTCLSALAPKASACQRLAGTADWAHPFPNDTHRSIRTCAGCQLFVVTEEFRPFHERRRKLNLQLAEEAASAGDSGTEKLCMRRAKQSDQFLQILDRA